MEILKINNISFSTLDDQFEWRVASTVGIRLAQKIISGAFDWCEENHKTVCKVEVTKRPILGTTWKITGGV